MTGRVWLVAWASVAAIPARGAAQIPAYVANTARKAPARANGIPTTVTASAIVIATTAMKLKRPIASARIGRAAISASSFSIR